MASTQHLWPRSLQLPPTLSPLSLNRNVGIELFVDRFQTPNLQVGAVLLAWEVLLQDGKLSARYCMGTTTTRTEAAAKAPPRRGNLERTLRNLKNSSGAGRLFWRPYSFSRRFLHANWATRMRRHTQHTTTRRHTTHIRKEPPFLPFSIFLLRTVKLRGRRRQQTGRREKIRRGTVA